MHTKEKDERIYERKDKANILKNKNVETLVGENRK